jgi:hypothetical protein
MIPPTLLSSLNNSPFIQVANFGNSPVKLRVNSILGSLIPYETYSTLDLHSAYHQVNNISTTMQNALSTVTSNFDDRDDLTPIQCSKLDNLLYRNQHVFDQHLTQFGSAHVTPHTIPLVPGTTPLKQRAYRHPEVDKAEIKAQITDMLNKGVIRPSSSPWSSPIVLVTKKDGSKRFCVDYRKLNHVTIKDSYPLPRVDDVLDRLHGARYFSLIDAKSGYWQFPILESDKQKTAFSSFLGLFEFEVMPFGLANAPASFQRAMDLIFNGLSWDYVLIYLDDIMVFSTTFEEHLQQLQMVFDKLASSKLHLNRKKCQFVMSSVKYLGHVVSANGIAPDMDKVAIITNTKPPTNLKELRSFLGLSGYYR